MSPQAGEVWLADLGLAAKPRPVVVLSPFDPAPPRSILIYLPVTRQNRGSRLEVPVGHLRWLDPDSTVNAQGIGSIPTVRFERKIGSLPALDFEKVKTAVRLACGV